MKNQQEKENKSRLEIFKYNAILSIIFFISSTFYLSRQIPNYSFSSFTISKMSYFLDPKKLVFFNLLFFIKGFMDLGFAFYVIRYFKLKYYSSTSISLLLAVLSFGLLGFFPTHQYKEIHIFLVYLIFFFWSLSEFLFARLTKNKDFQFLTNNLLIIQLTSIIMFVLTDNFNGVFEIFYMLFVFFWLMIFIGRYLD